MPVPKPLGLGAVPRGTTWTSEGPLPRGFGVRVGGASRSRRRQYSRLDPENPSPAANCGADCPLASQAFTRPRHSRSLLRTSAPVMPGSMRDARHPHQ